MVMAVGFWHWSLSTRLATRVYITKCMWVAGAWAWIVKVQHVQYTSVCRNAITSGTCKRWWQFRENWVSIAEQSEVKNQVLSVRYCTFSKASWSPTVFFISFKYSSSLTRVTRALSKVMTPPPPCRPGSGLRLTGTSVWPSHVVLTDKATAVLHVATSLQSSWRNFHRNAPYERPIKKWANEVSVV